jgi:methylmalonyl-CoA/ethylmalonyl-CoA epimerase
MIGQIREEIRSAKNYAGAAANSVIDRAQQFSRLTMGKIRHIALIVPDVEASAKFYQEAFDLKIVGRARRGIYLSDGTFNVALLKVEGDEKPGLYHFGVWVDDLAEAEERAQKAGATYMSGRPESPNSFYECKYKDPDGIIFDITHNGWVGAVRDVVPAREKAKADA